MKALLFPKAEVDFLAWTRNGLLVCGRICEAFQEPIPGVSFEGIVSDLDAYYERAALAINPVTYGSGLKIKSVEAIVHGRCLVCTDAGMLGLGKPEELPVIVSNDDETMANEIVQLLQNAETRWKLERHAFEFAQGRYRPELVYAELLDVLHICKSEATGLPS